MTIGITAIVGAAASIACTATLGVGLPTTAVTITPFGTCSGDSYYLLDSTDVGLYCASAGCGSTTYLLCDGTEWGGCDCTYPSGWVAYTGDPGFTVTGGDGGVGGDGGGGGGDAGGGGGDAGGGGGDAGGGGGDAGGGGGGGG